MILVIIRKWSTPGNLDEGSTVPSLAPSRGLTWRSFSHVSISYKLQLCTHEEAEYYVVAMSAGFRNYDYCSEYKGALIGMPGFPKISVLF